jgi:hypothetical protein
MHADMCIQTISNALNDKLEQLHGKYGALLHLQVAWRA